MVVMVKENWTTRTCKLQHGNGTDGVRMVLYCQDCEEFQPPDRNASHLHRSVISPVAVDSGF